MKELFRAIDCDVFGAVHAVFYFIMSASNNTVSESDCSVTTIRSHVYNVLEIHRYERE